MPTTSWPSSAIEAAWTAPRYPQPMTEIRTRGSISFCCNVAGPPRGPTSPLTVSHVRSGGHAVWRFPPSVRPGGHRVETDRFSTHIGTCGSRHTHAWHAEQAPGRRFATSCTPQRTLVTAVAHEALSPTTVAGDRCARGVWGRPRTGSGPPVLGKAAWAG